MNKYIIALFLVITFLLGYNIAQAQEICQTVSQDVNTPVPKDLENKEICIRDPKTGTSDCSKSTNEYKVVPRKQQFKVKEKVTIRPCDPIVVTETKQVNRKNILSLTLVRSLQDFEVSTSPGLVKISNEYKYGVGLMYQHNVYKDLYLGLQGDTNKNLGGNIGIGF